MGWRQAQRVLKCVLRGDERTCRSCSIVCAKWVCKCASMENETHTRTCARAINGSKIFCIQNTPIHPAPLLSASRLAHRKNALVHSSPNLHARKRANWLFSVAGGERNPVRARQTRAEFRAHICVRQQKSLRDDLKRFGTNNVFNLTLARWLPGS